MRAIIVKELAEFVRDRRLVVLGLLLAVFAAVAIGVGAVAQRDAAADRASAVTADRAIWRGQGEVNPHSAAHFGQFAFRVPPVLGLFDPGYTPFLGQAVWIEGHYQNPAQARPAEAATAIQRFGDLSPAWIMQALLPLLVILSGFAAMAGDRERGNLRLQLAQGVSGMRLAFGKAGALLVATGTGVALLLLVGVGSALAITGVSADLMVRVAALLAVYLIYLAIWCFITVAISSLVPTARQTLVVLLGLWVLSVVLVPRLAAEEAVARHPIPAAGAFWEDIAKARAEGIDGHNPADARAKALEVATLRRYGVTRVQDLPIDFGAISLQAGEDYGNRVFDRLYGKVVAAEQAQVARQLAFAFASPLIAVRTMSMGVSGSDLLHQQRFRPRSLLRSPPHMGLPPRSCWSGWCWRQGRLPGRHDARRKGHERGRRRSAHRHARAGGSLGDRHPRSAGSIGAVERRTLRRHARGRGSGAGHSLARQARCRPTGAGRRDRRPQKGQSVGASEPIKADWNAARPPGPLATLSFGREDIAPLSANVSLFMVRADSLFRKYEFASPVALATGRFDAGFLLVLLAPLFLLALGYGVLAEERETGRLRISAVQGRLVGQRLLIRLLLRQLPVYIAFAVVAVGGLLLLGSSGRFFLWLGVALVHLFFWSGVTAIIASVPRRQEVLALTAAAVWLALVVLLPAAGAAIARGVAPATSQLALINSTRTASLEANRRLLENLQGYISDHPEMAGVDASNDDWAAKLYVSQLVIERQIAPVLTRQDAADRHQARWTEALRFLSPTSIADQTLLELAGAGRARQAAYVSQATDFLAHWRATLSPMIFHRQRLTPARVMALPKFQFREPSARVGWVAVGLLALLGLAFGLAAIAAHRFRRAADTPE